MLRQFFFFFFFVLRRIATSIMCHGSKLQPTISFPFDSRSFLDTGHKHVLLPFFLNSVNVQPVARKLLHSSTMLLSVQRPCLVRKACKGKIFFASESSQFEVVNEVYLQNFLHGCVVNRETNLMMLINS